jgi:hypothetical protein
MTGKGKRLDASWTMARKLLASVSYRIAPRPQALQFGKESGRIETSSYPKAAEIKRAANFGKTLIAGRVAGLCGCRTPRKELQLDAPSFYLAAAHLPPTLAQNEGSQYVQLRIEIKPSLPTSLSNHTIQKKILRDDTPRLRRGFTAGTRLTLFSDDKQRTPFSTLRSPMRV